MCNAWNHPPNCTCGWGGKGHLGKRESGNYAYSSSFREYSWPDSQGNLNHPTLCPMCGEQVYFVRHNGGKVWFDELGPPWPKHPCFEDDLTGALLRANLKLDKNEKDNTFGIIVFAAEDNPGFHNYTIKCADGSTIDEHFESGWHLHTLPGVLLHIDRSNNNITISQFPSTSKPPTQISLRIRSLTPYSTATWFRDILDATEIKTESKIHALNSFLSSPEKGVNLQISELKGNDKSLEIVFDFESRKDLAFYLMNLNEKNIPHKIYGSESKRNLEVKCESPDGLCVIARIQPDQQSY